MKLGRQCVELTRSFQVDRLEQDKSEVLRLIRSVKNVLVPINRAPPEIVTLIPRCWTKRGADRDLIILTHVCKHWREVFIADSSLWTHLDCAHAAKTRVFIERSRSSPLRISLRQYSTVPRLRGNAFRLVLPHISRIASLHIIGHEHLLKYSTTCFSTPLPLLTDLDIDIRCDSLIALDEKLFNGDLPSLRTLSLSGVIPPSPWWSLSKLNTFVLGRVPGSGMSITQLLDFFANAPLLCKVELHSIPDSSNAPLGRVLSLPGLKNLAIISGQESPSALLDHLSIPTGAMLRLEFDSRAEDTLRTSLPKTSKNLKNIFFITSLYLNFSAYGVYTRLFGPSGELCMFGKREVDWSESTILSSDRTVLRSLDYFDTLSKIQTLAITTYELIIVEDMVLSPPHSILHVMKDLRILFLNVSGRPFILALDPDRNPSKLALCPKLESLILYVEDREAFDIGELMEMAERRALEGAKLRSITVVSLGDTVSENEVFKLKKYVTHVEYEVGEDMPDWDKIPGRGSS